MKFKLMLLVLLVSLMIIVAGCGLTPGESLAGNARSTGKTRLSAQVSCPGGIVCDGTPVTGKKDQVVCGTDSQNWKCTALGWQGQGDACECPLNPSISCSDGVVCDGTPVTGQGGQVVCGTDFKNWMCTANGWSGTGKTCVCPEKEIDFSTFSPDMKIRLKSLEMFSGCDKVFFDRAVGHNKIVATDWAKYYSVKKEEGDPVSITSIKELLNNMYAQINEQQAQEIAELLLLEEAKKKQFIISDAKLNDFSSIGSGSAGAAELKQQNSGSSLKDDMDGLLAIKKMIDEGTLTALDIGKSNSGSKEGGTDETNKASQAGDTPKASAFSGKGNFLQAGVGCASAAKGKGGVGSSSAKKSDSGSSGGAAGGGAVEGGQGQGQIRGEKTFEGGGGRSGGSSSDAKFGGGKAPVCAPGSQTDECKGNGPKKKKEGFAGDPSEGGEGDGIGNSEFAKDQASGKSAPCQAVNWDAVEGDTGKAGYKIFAGSFNTKDFVGWAIVRIKDGTKTTTLLGKDGNGKDVDKETKEPAKPGEGSNDKIGVPIKTKDGGTANLNVPKETDSDKKDDKDKSKDGKDGDSKGGDSKDDSAKGDGSSSKSKGMTDPSAETAKSNLKKCDSSWAAAYSGCVMNLLMDEFKSEDKSTDQESCEKVGQGGPDAGLNCGKKKYGADGFDVNSFFGTGSSQGAGVTDPADK